MKSSAIAIVLCALTVSANAQDIPDTIAPCFVPAEALSDVTDAFQSDGWTLIEDETDRTTAMMAASESLVAAQNLSRVDTPEGHDSHIQTAHERAAQFLDGTTVLRKDTLFAVVEFQQFTDVQTIRCTIAGTDWDAPSKAFAARQSDVVAMHGHQFLITPLENGPRQSDLTWYRLTTPQGSTIEPLGPNALIGTVSQ